MDFSEVYQLYFKDVYLYIFSMSNNSSLAEDITQETFFKALKNLNSFRNECSMKTWLCRIAKNAYLSHLDKHKNLSQSPTPEAAVDFSTEQLVIRKSEALSIYKVLHYLEDPYKEVFTLRVLGELSFAEIGEIFSRKEGWARVTYHRARQKIQSLIKED